MLRQQCQMRHSMQVQIGALTSVAGWQSQAWALQNIGIDLFAEAKEASSCQVQVAVRPHAYCGGHCSSLFLNLFSVSLTHLLPRLLAHSLAYLLIHLCSWCIHLLTHSFTYARAYPALRDPFSHS